MRSFIHGSILFIFNFNLFILISTVHIYVNYAYISLVSFTSLEKTVIHKGYLCGQKKKKKIIYWKFHFLSIAPERGRAGNFEGRLSVIYEKPIKFFRIIGLITRTWNLSVILIKSLEFVLSFFTFILFFSPNFHTKLKTRFSFLYPFLFIYFLFYFIYPSQIHFCFPKWTASQFSSNNSR